MNKILLPLTLLTFSVTCLANTELDGAKNNSNYVSQELFSLIEGWKSGAYKTMPMEEFVIDEAQSHYVSWLDRVSVKLGKDTIIDYFKAAEPKYYQSYLSSIENTNEPFNTSNFIDFIRTSKPSAFYVFQQQQLASLKLTLEDYVQSVDPSLYRVWQTDKDKGTFNINGSLSSYIDNNHQSDRVLEEAKTVLANMGVSKDQLPRGTRGRDDVLSYDRGSECNCSVTVSNAGNPNDGNTLHNYAPQGNIEYKNNGKIKRSWSLTKSAIGAAHSIRVDRYTRNGRENEVDSSLSTNYRSVTLSLGCMDENSFPCAGYCSGDIVTQSQYHSDLKADINITGGILAKHGVAVASDSGKLTLLSSGYSGVSEETLFNKALAVEREYQTEYDTDALMSLVKTTTGIVTTVMTGVDATAVANAISADAVADTVKSSIGLIKKTGKSASYIDKNMLASFNTADTYANIFFDINTSATLKLSSDARVHAHGNNGYHNTGWAQLDSAYFLAVGAKNFQCSGDVTTVPNKTSNWSYGRTAGAEVSTTTLQNNINGFLATELGQSTDFSSGNSGGIVTVPPQIPPVAVCDISPSTGINSLNAIMDASLSTDSDGSIVNYEWVRYPGHPIAEDIIDMGVTANLVITTAPKSYQGFSGIHLRVTDNMGLSDTSYCGNVIVQCIVGGEPCPMPEYSAQSQSIMP